MPDYVLRIRTPTLQKKEVTIDELVEKLGKIEDLTLVSPPAQTMKINYVGTLEDLYALLGYDKRQVIIEQEKTYSIPTPPFPLKK